MKNIETTTTKSSIFVWAKNIKNPPLTRQLLKHWWKGSNFTKSCHQDYLYKNKKVCLSCLSKEHRKPFVNSAAAKNTGGQEFQIHKILLLRLPLQEYKGLSFVILRPRLQLQEYKGLSFVPSQISWQTQPQLKTNNDNGDQVSKWPWWPFVSKWPVRKVTTSGQRIKTNVPNSQNLTAGLAP